MKIIPNTRPGCYELVIAWPIGLLKPEKKKVSK